MQMEGWRRWLSIPYIFCENLSLYYHAHHGLCVFVYIPFPLSQSTQNVAVMERLVFKVQINWEELKSKFSCICSCLLFLLLCELFGWYLFLYASGMWLAFRNFLTKGNQKIQEYFVHRWQDLKEKLKSFLVEYRNI